MRKVETATGRAKGTAMVTSMAASRYSFTAQYLCASAIFARRCAETERANSENPDEPTRTEHRGLVTATIMQCVAAVEAESAEVVMHGPGSRLGSDRTDARARDLLAPYAKFIEEKLPALLRYKLILLMLQKPPLREGEQTWQGMDTLMRLRNELVHYKSEWSHEMDRKAFFKTLEHLRLEPPPFVPAKANFFPEKLLGAACAAWSVRTAVAFLNGFYHRMGPKAR
jgi:hypothetical protein